MFYEMKSIKSGEEFGKIFEDIFGVDFMKDPNITTKQIEKTWSTELDNKKFKIVMEMPGVKKDNISITYDKNVLTIIYGNSHKLSKTFGVNSDKFDVHNIKTCYADGVLTFEIPALETLKTEPLKIDIQ